MKKCISWVTPVWFLDTDIYVMKYLPQYFKVNWYIVKGPSNKLDYKNLIADISEQEDIIVSVVEQPGGIFSLKLLKHLISFQKKIYSNVDYVYQPSGFVYNLPTMLFWGDRKKTVVPIHNVNTPKGARLYYLSKLYNEFTIKFYKNFATFSDSQYQLLNKKKNGKANILATSFMLKDYGQATRERNDDRITFMNFGNIIEYKRIDVLIQAAQLAYEDTGVLFRVLLAGYCKKWEKYASLIKYTELFDLRIKRVDDEEIPNIFEESDYFVAPYQDIAQSGSTIVAVNYNKPIIASKIEAFEDIVEDGVSGYLIKPADVQDLRNIICSILRNHNQVYPKLKKGQQVMIEKKFKDDVIVKQYADFFNRL